MRKIIFGFMIFLFSFTCSVDMVADENSATPLQEIVIEQIEDISINIVDIEPIEVIKEYPNFDDFGDEYDWLCANGYYNEVRGCGDIGYTDKFFNEYWNIYLDELDILVYN